MLEDPKLFIIEYVSPYQHLENDPFRVFSKLLKLRRRGYGSRHDSHALPVDTYDFIGTHILIARDAVDGIEVLGGYRRVSASQAMRYNLPFPLISMLANSNANRACDFVIQKLELFQKEGIEAEYVSSWTFDPCTRNDPTLLEAMHALVTATNVLSHPVGAVARFACGVLRLKTDAYIEWLGYHRQHDQDGALPEIQQANLMGEPVVLYGLETSHSLAAYRAAEPYRALWENRWIIETNDSGASISVKLKSA